MRHEGLVSNGAPLGVGAPPLLGPYRRRHPASGEYGLFHLLGPESRQRRLDGLGIGPHVEDFQQRFPVPRVVGVSADPAVGGPPEP